CLEIPSYIADALREAAGDRRAVVNATDLLMHPETGLRAINSPAQLAVLEFGATFASQGVQNMTERVEPGMTELALVEQARLNGLPLSCHPVINSGPRAPSLASPSLRRIEEGDPILFAIGVWGGLTARAGFAVRDARGLADANRDYVETFVKPYFAAAVDWYETIGMGVTGGQMYDLIQQHLTDRPFSIALNPGHLIHLDEWVHSGFAPRSKTKLLSGMAIQLDIIPVPQEKAYFTTNVEDGIALADETLRNALAAAYPEMWGRIQARKRFMRDVLGIRLKEEVLPFSNMPGVLQPYLLSPHRALRAL
ncbi:MAG: M24 family metallopeptidase, partial [Candidatus Latescibacteria bacterium]|nr:M24 family metallopeptidase [Candidatus Latescibacterota bacterium]